MNLLLQFMSVVLAFVITNSANVLGGGTISPTPPFLGLTCTQIYGKRLYYLLVITIYNITIFCFHSLKPYTLNQLVIVLLLFINFIITKIVEIFLE